MPLPPRMMRRGNVYWHRCSIPRDIRDTYPKTEETFSLDTKDYQEALRRLRKAAAEVDGRFERHRRELQQRSSPALDELTQEHVKLIEDAYYTHLLEEDEELRLDGMNEKEFDERVEVGDDIDSVNRFELSRGVRSEFAMSEAKEVMTWMPFDLAPGAESWGRVIRAILTASVKAADVRRKRDSGDPIETPATASVPGRQQTVPLLSVIAMNWVNEKARVGGSWTAKTSEANRLWAERFIEFTGDRSADSYSKADGRDFKSALLKLPPNFVLNPLLKGLSLKDAASRAAEVGIAPMSASNVNKIIGFVSGLWNHAIQNYDGVTVNPFAGQKVKTSVKARKQRQPFSSSELSKIFNSPLFTGCQSERYHNTPGDMVPDDLGIYWVPLVGLYTGARSGEIIQLRTEDVHTEAGITYFQITDDDGEELTIKTAGSYRRIPVHKQLVKLGFLDFVAQRRRKKQKRLFPEMPRAADRTYSTNYSRKFSNLLMAVEIKHKRNAFHSLRHSFEDACIDSRIPMEFVNALQGHSEAGMAGRYGSGIRGLKALSEEMDKLAYEGLDLSRLRAKRNV